MRPEIASKLKQVMVLLGEIEFVLRQDSDRATTNMVWVIEAMRASLIRLATVLETGGDRAL